MKCRWHIILLILLVALQNGMLWAQPQFRNTTGFDTGDSLYYWSARIGSRIYQDSVFDDTTTGYHVMSTCTYTPDLVGDSVIKNVYVRTSFQILYDTVWDSIYGTNIDTIYVDTVSFFTDSCRDYGQDANMYRFFIYGPGMAGMDQFTVDTLAPGSGMSRIAPGYSKSIRLGCMVDSRAGLKVDSNDALLAKQIDSLLHIRLAISEREPLTPSQQALLGRRYPGLDTITDTAAFLDEALESYHYGSQSLFYTMRVTPENALLIINYAIVARRYDHTAYDAGEFLVRIVQRDSSGRWANGPINDNLWYKVSAPEFTTELSDNGPWRSGSAGSKWPCRYVYKPWNKCVVNLSEFIGEDIRIEFYTSNCIYGVDPLYAYIAGDYGSPILTATGCPTDASPFIDTLRAPEGLIGYEWFVSTDGPQEDLFDFEHLDSVHFRRLTGVLSSNVYCPTLTDFVINRDTLTHQTFMCLMHSALDPAKPFTSRLYANVYNHKPVLRCEVLDSCDRSLTFISHATPPVGDSLDLSSLYWVIYDDLNGEVVLDTLYGDSVTYLFTETRPYMVEQSVAVYEEDDTTSPCRGSRRSFHSVKGPTDVGVLLSSRAICAGETLLAECMFDSTARSQWRNNTLNIEWRVDGNKLQQLTTEYRLEHDTILVLPALDEGMHIIEIYTTNRQGCQSRNIDTVYVYENPRILVEPRSRMLCLGDTLVLSAFRDDMQLDSAWFEWTVEPPDPTFEGQQGQPVLHLQPTENSAYTLHSSPLSHCQQDDITVFVEVFSYPVPMLSYKPQTIDFDRPTVTLEDETPDAWRTIWTFDDGTVVSGTRASHIFNSPSLEGVDIVMQTCNRALCCSNYTVHIPVGVLSLWIPNTIITSDEANKYFSVQSNQELLDFEIYVYNRRGLLVYSSNDPHFQWDGTDNHGQSLPQETYVYIIGYRMPSTGEYRYSARGTVTLLH